MSTDDTRTDTHLEPNTLTSSDTAARDGLESTQYMPPSDIGEGEGHFARDARHCPAPILSDVCSQLRELQAQRRFCINCQSKVNNAVGAFARRLLGWRVDMPEKERASIRKRADKLIKLLRKGDEIPEELLPAASVLAPFVHDAGVSLAPFDARRLGIEKRMKDLAAGTPGHEFQESVKGFGLLGLAMVVGEAGNLSDYATVSRLWKRLGWAPPDSYPKGEKSEGRKIPRRVKGELYGGIVESLMKQNGDGKYKSLYDARKVIYMEGGKTKLHAHKLAMRVMLKELLKDLWRAWNGHGQGDSLGRRADCPRRCRGQ